MLNALREGSKSGFSKFILFGFMALAVGGLVFMDIGGFFRGDAAGNNAVAKINGQELSLTTFDNTLRRALSSQGLDVQTAYNLGLVNQVLNNEISNNITQAAAADLGLQVGDETVLKQINRLIEPLVTDEMDKRSALAAVLRNQGMTERDFVRMIKAEMTNMLLRNVFQTGTALPSIKAAQDLYQYENERRAVKTVFLPYSLIKDVAVPADEILLPFYQAGQERYAIPEMRGFTIGILSHEKLEKTLDVSDEELRSIYERDLASYSKPEQRVLEQVVVDNQGDADAILASTEKGKSLKEAVKDVTDSEDFWLGEESFEKAGLPEAIGEAAFSAEPDQMIGPIETSLGWHILKLKKIIAPATEPFASVKSTLKKDIVNLRVADEMFAAAGQIDDLFAGGASLEDVATEMALETRQFSPLKRDGSTTDNKDGIKDFEQDWAYMLETVFTLRPDEVSPVFQLADGRYAVLRVDSVQEKTYRPFEDVKPDLAKIWIQDQKKVAVKLLAEEALSALKDGSKTFAQIAAANGRQIDSDNLVRAEDPPKDLGKTMKFILFELPENQFALGPVEGGYRLGQVIKITLPDTDNVPAETLKPFLDTVKRNEQSELIELYYKKLQDDYNVKINARLLHTTYGPGSEGS